MLSCVSISCNLYLLLFQISCPLEFILVIHAVILSLAHVLLCPVLFGLGSQGNKEWLLVGYLLCLLPFQFLNACVFAGSVRLFGPFRGNWARLFLNPASLNPSQSFLLSFFFRYLSIAKIINTCRHWISLLLQPSTPPILLRKTNEHHSLNSIASLPPSRPRC